jgi:deoxyribonuclease-4
MVKVGVHVSIAGSIAKSVDRALESGCDSFQIFSRNPRGWGFKDLSEEDSLGFADRLLSSGIAPAIDHMPYLPNLATPKEDVYEKSVTTLIAELNRCSRLRIPFLVTHLGHHLGDGIAKGCSRVIDAVNRAFEEAPGPVMLLLENTAGEKNGVGNRFEDIQAVMDGISDLPRIGICLDTCHAFAAGYEMRTADGLEATLRHFDDVIGIRLIHVVHLNDTKGDLGSGLDRHEHIGLGKIGEEGFRTILSHEPFRSLPLICETPEDDRRDGRGNILKVRELAP